MAHLSPAVWSLILLSAIWGYNWLVMKECLRFCPPFEFAALRTTIGAMSLFVYLALKGSKLKPRAPVQTFILGFFSTTLCIGLVTLSLHLGAVGKTAILVYIMPFWVLILARPILSERLYGLHWIAVPLAFLGLVLTLEPWNLRTLLYGIPPVLAGVAWAVSVIYTKIIRKNIEFELISLTAWQMLFGAIPLALTAALISREQIHWTPYFVVGLVYSAVISQAVALALWFYILQELPAGMASLGTLATPVLGTLMAAIQLGERPTLTELSGMILIVIGLILLTIQGMVQVEKLNRYLFPFNYKKRGRVEDER
ncbi:MAG: DMT family transporter [Syntrophales bacterium]|nr:DMT family transporter [Syntrophales bacterium]